MINQLRQLISQRQHNRQGDGNQYAGNLNGFSRFPAGLRLVIFCTVLGKAGKQDGVHRMDKGGWQHQSGIVIPTMMPKLDIASCAETPAAISRLGIKTVVALERKLFSNPAEDTGTAMAATLRNIPLGILEAPNFFGRMRCPALYKTK